MADGVDPLTEGAHVRGYDVPRTDVTATSSRGWRSYLPGTADGKLPWRWRWLGVPLLLAICTVSGWWSWDHMEDQLDERALVHLGCEGIDTSNLSTDWSYRSVTVEGELPAGVSPGQIEQIIDGGSTDAACLEQAGIDADADPGVYDVNVLAAAGTAALADPAATAVPATPEQADEDEATAAPEPADEEPGELAIASIDATATFDGESITLAGVVASEAQRQTIVDAANRTVGSANVIDRLEVADGEPSSISDERAGEMATLVSQFDVNAVTGGLASANDEALTYAFEVVSEEARDALDLPGTGTIDVRPAIEAEPEPEPEPDEAPPADADADADEDADAEAADSGDTPAGTVEFTG